MADGFSAAGSVCLGNDDNARGIDATGNSLLNCATPFADASGLNAYQGNSDGQPSAAQDANGDLLLPQNLTIGSFRTPGSLTLQNNGQTMFSVDSSGNVTSTGNLTDSGAVAAGSLTAGSVTANGPLVLNGTGSYLGAQQTVGNFFWPGNPGNRTITLNAASGGFPAATNGRITIFGELSCDSPNNVASWHVVGHYAARNGALTPGAFSATLENDADTRAFAALSGNQTITPVANPATPGLRVSFGTGIVDTFDCTSMLSEMIGD